MLFKIINCGFQTSLKLQRATTVHKICASRGHNWSLLLRKQLIRSIKQNQNSNNHMQHIRVKVYILYFYFYMDESEYYY